MDTKFNFWGPNHKIVIEAVHDPKVQGVTCHWSRSKTGGLKSMVGSNEPSQTISALTEITSHTPATVNLLSQALSIVITHEYITPYELQKKSNHEISK